MNTLGDRIRAARHSAGLSQHGLARLLGVTDQSVTRWELGTREPRMDTLRRVAEALGTTLAALVAEKES